MKKRIIGDVITGGWRNTVPLWIFIKTGFSCFEKDKYSQTKHVDHYTRNYNERVSEKDVYWITIKWTILHTLDFPKIPFSTRIDWRWTIDFGKRGHTNVEIEIFRDTHYYMNSHGKWLEIYRNENWILAD